MGNIVGTPGASVLATVPDGNPPANLNATLELILDDIATLDALVAAGGGGGSAGYYDLAGGFDSTSTDGYLDSGVIPRAVTFADGDSFIKAGTNPTATATVTVKKNGASVGTLTISSAGVKGSTGFPLSFAAGDTYRLELSNGAGSSGLVYALGGSSGAGPATFDILGGFDAASSDGYLDSGVIPRAATFAAADAYIKAGTNPTVSASILIYKNGVDTTARLTISSAGVKSTSGTWPVVFATGDRFRLELSNGAGSSGLVYGLGGVAS
jgi:hypothetical protein